MNLVLCRAVMGQPELGTVRPVAFAPEPGVVRGKRLPYRDSTFFAVMSNSIVHHIPEPKSALEEALRVTRRGGRLFFRDLLRPETDADVLRLVDTYAAGANDHQRSLFDASLRAALTLDEVKTLVDDLGLCRNCVQQTSDRHWTFASIVA